MGDVFAPSLVLKQSRCENPWRQFIAWGRQSDHHPRVVGAFVSACPAPACWSSLAVSLLRSFEIWNRSTTSRAFHRSKIDLLWVQISNPQTLRPTDSSLFEFKKCYCKSICVCMYIYIYIFIYLIYLILKKNIQMSTQCTAGSQLASVPRWAAPRSFEGPPVASPTASPVPWCSDGAYSASSGGICWAKNHGENDNYPIFSHNSNMENHDKQLDFGV